MQIFIETLPNTDEHGCKHKHQSNIHGDASIKINAVKVVRSMSYNVEQDGGDKCDKNNTE